MDKNVKLKVPSRSGFDKSFQNLLTTKVGTLTPILVDELIPNSKVDLSSVVSASLPPLASDTFMRCNLKVEAFFVPSRLLYGGYEDWLTGNKILDMANAQEVSVGLPALTAFDSHFGDAGTLADYLGVKNPRVLGSDLSDKKFNIFPFLAYHRIYDDWYRNVLVQTPVFSRAEPSWIEENGNYLSNMPYQFFAANRNGGEQITFASNDQFNDGVMLNELRQRNFGLDYFTAASPQAQLGDAKSVKFTVANNQGSFTIASLRAMNSLQQFAERNALAGTRLQDFVKANYGADLSSGVAQRSIYLGSAEIPVYSKGVYTQSPSTAPATNNPFGNTVGAEFGTAECAGNANLVNDFVAAEPGYLMVIASLVPVVTYGSGISRLLGRYTDNDSQTDLANPILQNVGNQPIFQWELSSSKYGGSSVFGYTDRYADFKYKNDELHGLLRDGEDLSAFALQRNFSADAVIGTQFLKIPVDYLDQVAAVTDSISDYGCWMDCFFKYHVSMPLAEYSIPSLQDPAYEHGYDVDVQVRGSRID